MPKTTTLTALTTAALALTAAATAGAQTTFDTLAAFEAAAGPTTLEDFNDEAAPFFVDASDTLVTSTFSVRNDGTAGDVGINTGDATRAIDGTNFLEIVLTTDDDLFPGSIFLEFAVPIDALAFEVGDIVTSGTDASPNSEIVLLTETGDLLATVDDTLVNGEGFFGVTFDTPQQVIEIDLVALNGNGTFDFTGLDNVRFATVPEPTSLALLGLAACGLVRRR